MTVDRHVPSSVKDAALRRYLSKIANEIASTTTTVSAFSSSAGSGAGSPGGGALPGGGGDPRLDLTIPDAPTNVVANTSINYVVLTWANVFQSNVSHAEIWRAETDDLGQAVLRGTAKGPIYGEYVGPNKTFYYWVRYATYSGVVFSPYQSINGIEAITPLDPTELLEVLNGQLTASQLHTSLATPISLITEPVTGVIDRLGTAEAGISGITTSVDSLVASVAGITTSIGTINGDITTINLNVATIGSDLATVQTTIVNINASIAALVSSTSTVSNDLASLTTTVGVITSDLANVTTIAQQATTDVASLTITVGSVSSDLTALTTVVATTNSNLASLTTTVGVVTSDLANVTTIAQQATTDVASLTITVGSVSSDLSALTSTVSTATSDLASLTTNVGVITSDLANVTTIAQQATTDVASLTTTVASVSSNVTSLTTTVATATTDLASLTTQVGVIGTDVAAVETLAAVNASDLTNIEAKYTVKLDVNGNVAGFGLISTQDPFDNSVHSEMRISVDTFFITSPGATELAFAVDNGVVVMDGAFIRDATINDAKLGTVTVGAISGINSSFLLSTIGTGNITNAYIGNVIQSNNYVAGVSGWRINKDGTAEFPTLLTNYIQANDIDVIGTLMIQDNAVTIPSSASTTGTINITNGQNFVEVQSITFTSSGQPYHIAFNCIVEQGNFAVEFSFQIRRRINGGSSLIVYGTGGINTGLRVEEFTSHPISLGYAESALAGQSIEISVHIATTGSSSALARARVLKIVEYKK